MYIYHIHIRAYKQNVEECNAVALSRAWTVAHPWQDVHTYGSWSLQVCVYVHVCVRVCVCGHVCVNDTHMYM